MQTASASPSKKDMNMKKSSKFNCHSILLFTTMILTIKSHATTINLESKPSLKIISTISSTNHELYINLDKITCKINYPYRTDALPARLSSDNEFIILNNGAFAMHRRLEDMHQKRNIFKRYFQKQFHHSRHQ